MRKMFLFCAILALLGQAAPLRMAIPRSEGNLTPYTYLPQRISRLVPAHACV